jgi:signal peptidase
MHKAGVLMRKVLIAFMGAAVLLNLYILVAQVVLRHDLPKVFGVTQVVVVSGSMQPAIGVGDLLLIRQQAEYSVNDIITYRVGSRLITHRVKSVEGASLVTQGDANNVADAPIMLSQVEGKVLIRVPKLGRVVPLLRTPQGILLIMFTGVVLIVAPYIADKSKRPEIS